MKKVLSVIAVVLLIIFGVTIVSMVLFSFQAKAEPTLVKSKCPEGSYYMGEKEEGGEPLCRLFPTGCPYGDSIPMDDCDKHKPEEVQPPIIVEEVVEELPIFEGK